MASQDLDAVTWPVQLTSVMHRELYPLLEPSNPALAATGKTVLVTGVTGGVGKSIAEAWATAGAAAMVITGRKVDILEAVAARLQEGIPAAAKTKIVVHAADLRSESEVRELWARAQVEIGKIDVLVNDAGHMSWGQIGTVDPSEWWSDYVFDTIFLTSLPNLFGCWLAKSILGILQEVNVKGTYLMIHHFLKQQGSNPTGTVITLSTGAAGMSLPSMSSYISSKLAQTRIMEIVQAEQPEVRCFTLLPGLLKTAMTAEAFLPFARDDPMLAGGMTLFLSTPHADWLKGGVVSVNCKSSLLVVNT